jgi:hypothetical protein
VIKMFVSPSLGNLKVGYVGRVQEEDKSRRSNRAKSAAHGDYKSQIVDRTLSAQDLGRI